MFTVKEFVLKFESYGDDELFEIYSNWNNYSEEAREAFNIVISNKGGVENLLARHAEKLKFLEEAGKIRKAAVELCMSGSDIAFAKKMITSNYLPQEKVSEIIEGAFHVAEQAKEDVKIKPRTIYGSILGGIVASIVSGLLWGALLIYSERILLVLLIAPALICYWIIKAFTKQSKNNIVILIATIIAVCVAVQIGRVLFTIVGFRGISGS
jgi:hypothetical protein